MFPGRISIVREGCVPFSKSCGCRAKVHPGRTRSAIVHQLSVVTAVKSKKKITCGGYLTDGRDEADESPLTPQHERILQAEVVVVVIQPVLSS